MKTNWLAGAIILCSSFASMNAQNSVVGSLNVAGESKFNGYSTFNEFVEMKKSAWVDGELFIYTETPNQHFRFYETDYSTPIFGSYTKNGALLPMTIESREFNIQGGTLWVRDGFQAHGYASFTDGLTVFSGNGSPLNVKISDENLVPTIGFYGKSGFTNSGKFRASSFTFAGGPVAIGEEEIQEGVKLQVSGKILCTGDIEVASIDAEDINTKGIKTDDITVKMNDVADYVFEENYNLKQLSEVEAYVKENKHLPGIPSASEIEENGVSLSKMTNMLLEKVEELTLHMIQLEKENAALKNRLEILEK